MDRDEMFRRNHLLIELVPEVRAVFVPRLVMEATA